MTSSENTVQLFEQYRVLLFSIAYRMLGSATDAEDIIQEAFVHWLQADEAAIQLPKAYLSTIVVRLCIDQLRSARVQREVYIGAWLPEPVLTGLQGDVAETALLDESLSFAFLVLLENLGPLERAVFLLREVFEYEYGDIAAIAGKSEANCRQILHRAQQHLQQRRSRFEVSRSQQQRITDLFVNSCVNGDMQGLLNVLAEDIVMTSDGGGKVRAARRAIYGPDKVARGLLGILNKIPAGSDFQFAFLNAQPALMTFHDHQLYGVLILDMHDQRIRHLYLVVNPEKLRWLDRELSRTKREH